MMHWVELGALGFKVPPNFPMSSYDEIRLILEKYKDTHKAQCKSFGLGWHGVAYRYRALFEYDLKFTDSVTVSNAPPPEERYQQGKALFGFFINSLSVIECFFYAMYSIASILEPVRFPITRAEDLNFYPEHVESKYSSCFSGELIATEMNQCLNEPIYKDMKDIRNVITHRGMPPRAFHIGDDRNGMAFMPANIRDPSDQWHFDFPIDSQTTSTRRQWLVDSLNKLMKAACNFCKRRL